MKNSDTCGDVRERAEHKFGVGNTDAQTVSPTSRQAFLRALELIDQARRLLEASDPPKGGFTRSVIGQQKRFLRNTGAKGSMTESQANHLIKVLHEHAQLQTEPVWIVNDMAELGVMINGRAFFLYKGDNLEYPLGEHDDLTPILYRRVGKREFGETCKPAAYFDKGWHKWATGARRYSEPCVYTPGLSDGPPDNPEYQWRELPKRVQGSGIHASQTPSDTNPKL